MNDVNIRDALSTLTDLLPIDETLVNARSYMRNFNEYIAGETNNIHHTEICDALDSGEDVLAVLPRNAAKTTTICTRYPAYRLGRDRALRVLVSSCNATLAQSFLRSIESYFEQENFKLAFGTLVPKMNTTNYKWNESEKIVASRPERNKMGYRIDAKDASLFAVGVGGAVVGRRADIIILDDIIDRKTVKTNSQIQDIKYWLTEEVKGVRHAHTQVIMTGTRWSTKDVYVDTMNMMIKSGAVITGNMVDEVLEQVEQYKAIEDIFN